MEEIENKIKEDLSLALKNKNTEEVSVLRMVLSNVHLKEKEKNYSLKKENKTEESRLTNEEVTNILLSESKKRKDSILLFERGNRQDLAEKEKRELKILFKYLPEELSEDKIREIIKEVIDSGKNNFKDIIVEVMPKVKRKADGSIVSKIIKEMLGS